MKLKIGPILMNNIKDSIISNQKKPLCYAPFYAICIKGDKFKPCCVYDGYFDITTDDFWNNPAMQEIRTKLLSNNFPKGCDGCKMNYLNNIETDLNYYNSFIETQQIDIEFNVETGNQDGSPIELDFRPSNLCNLQCRMCDFTNSSLIANEINENVKLQEFLKIKTKFLKTKGVSSSSEFVFEWLKDKNFKKIKVLGGEPTIEKSTLNLLQTINSKPIVEMTTNLAVITKQFKKTLKNIDMLNLRISIDAIDEHYNYIRTNGNWHKLQKNLNYITSVNNVKITGFNVVLMPYNIFNLTDTLIYLYNFLKNNNICDYSISLFPSTDDAVKVSAILPEDRAYLLNSLLINSKLIGNEYAIVENIFKNIPFNEFDKNKFIKYSKILDSIRKTNLTNLNSGFEKYYNQIN